ncbi:MAG: diguanylate cyclase [Mariniblastus sp.]
MTLNSGHPTASAPSANFLNEAHDATIQKTVANCIEPPATESCLVQIYPPDVVDGMMKLNETVVLGRDQSSSCVLADNSVSRRHAEVSPTQDGYCIRDLGSTNGTLVNGEQIEQRDLNSGDTIQVGSFLFRFLTAGSVESKYHETVYTALTRDALTGTMNRRYMIESLNREITRSKRSGDTVAVAMLDIDHFKSVNDTHGHLVGDEVLSEFGQRITNVDRADDMLARFGGEEFCLVLSATEKAEAEAVLERCRKSIADKRFATAAGEIPITASFGFVCVKPSDEMTVNEILEEADKYLYEAKNSGRNRICGN